MGLMPPYPELLLNKKTLDDELYSIRGRMRVGGTGALRNGSGSITAHSG